MTESGGFGGKKGYEDMPSDGLNPPPRSDSSETLMRMYKNMEAQIEDAKFQRILVLIIVSAALLLDNMLYMVIVPIIPDYLRKVNAWDTKTSYATKSVQLENGHWMNTTYATDTYYEGEDTSLGFLFASKAFIQLIANPVSGTLIDRVGYEVPMVFGLFVMFVSTTIFAFGETYTFLFLARCMQGIGSAFADTAGLAMIADRFTEERERNRALGIALAFISFGFLFAPPFGGVLYEFCGKEVPFLCLACVALLDAAMLLLVSSKNTSKGQPPHAQVPHAPIYKLLLDPDVLVISGALIMANISLAFLEPTIATWMEDSMDADQWQQGIIWLPGFFPHIFGVYLCVQLSNKYAKTQYIYAGVGLCVIGISTCFIPACSTFTLLILPICGMCFGVALVDTALIPALSYLVDSRYTSVYGSVYAIADISYSLAYAFGPVIAGWMVHLVGFTFLNIIVGIASCLYAPMVYCLRGIYGHQAELQARRQEQSALLDHEDAIAVTEEGKDTYFDMSNGAMGGAGGGGGYQSNLLSNQSTAYGGGVGVGGGTTGGGAPYQTASFELKQKLQTGLSFGSKK